METLVSRGITLNGIVDQLGMPWDFGKVPLVVPLLKLMVNICLVMSVMLFLDRVYMGIVKLFIKLLRRKPEKNYKWEAMKDDIELGSSAFPMVLVQIPMYNEKEVPMINILCLNCLHSYSLLLLIFLWSFSQVGVSVVDRSSMCTFMAI